MDQWIREQYKSKGGFGMTNLETRRSASAVNRKEQRNTLLRKLRNIPETMSPLNSPMVSKVTQEKETVSRKVVPDSKSKRLMMLKKWKEEKEKRKLEEKKKAKPVFKVFHVEHKENLEDVYKNIKGKTIGSKGKASMTPLLPSKAPKNASSALRTFNFRPGKTEGSKIAQNQRNDVSKSQDGTKLRQKIPENTKKPGKVLNKLEKNSNFSKPNSSVKLNFEAEPTNKNQSKDKKVPKSPAPKEQNKSNSASKNKIDNQSTANKNKRISRGKLRRRNQNNSEETLPSSSDNHDELKVESDSNEQNAMEDILETNNDFASKELPEQKTPRRSKRTTRIEENEEVSPKPSSKKNKRDRTPSSGSSKGLGKSSGSETDSVEKSLEDDVFSTPQRISEDEICYVSPFVTMSRGKTAARKEFEQRKSLNGSLLNNTLTNATDPRSPRAAADYFTRVLSNEIARIQEKCKIWQDYKDEGIISEDASGLIDMTIGQSNLLITKKFNQFRGLIERCRSNDELDNKVQCEDLHGFWDMIYKQVTDVDKRFENLEDMRRNNWLEEVPKVETPKVAVKTKKRGKAKSTKASSALKETILAARKFRMKQVKSEGDVEILIAGKKGTPKRLSRNLKEVGTPGKGILKSANVRSEKRKTVVFHNVVENTDEDKVNSPRIFRGTPIPSRRSERLSLNRSKLVFEE